MTPTTPPSAPSPVRPFRATLSILLLLIPLLAGYVSGFLWSVLRGAHEVGARDAGRWARYVRRLLEADATKEPHA